MACMVAQSVLSGVVSETRTFQSSGRPFSPRERQYASWLGLSWLLWLSSFWLD